MNEWTTRLRAGVTVRVIPTAGPVIHRFFDTSPFSPSGRYLGLTRLPTDTRMPTSAEEAEVVVADLESGVIRTVERTLAWDTQLGAQVQWGRDDGELLYNVVGSGRRVHGRMRDVSSGATRDLDGEIYMGSAVCGEVVSASLLHMGLKQPGYGVHWAGPEDWSRAADMHVTGITVTPLDGDPGRLIVSIATILEKFPELRGNHDPTVGDYVCFHTKWNPQATRIMTAFFWMAPDGRGSRNAILTMAPDGSDLALALHPDRWALGGHHPNWCPDGEDILMNLKPDGKTMRFVRFRHDGGAFTVLSDTLVGSGHPTLHPDGRHILTDAYPHEVGSGATTVPLRWIDLHTQTETALVDVPCVPQFLGERLELRIDPHPAWDMPFQRAAINCLDEGGRKVAVVDLGACL